MVFWKEFPIECLLYILIISKKCVSENFDTKPNVDVAQGTIIGVKIYPDSSRMAINAYLGIPYAEPPEGRLRFAVPERHRGWNGTLYAANYGPICPFQTNTKNFGGKEDCLYLNIWTPEDAYGFEYPVLIYMESEQVIGNVRISGYDLAAEGAVVVSVSYRRNIFGFFCLGVPNARGNLGLLDQYLALIWIKENISRFGGNSQQITIVGHSSSAVSVVYHLTSPRTSGLFTRAIIMSGSAITSWLTKDPIHVSKRLASDLGCAMPTDQGILECLRKKSVEEILRQFDRQFEDDGSFKSIMPVVDTFLDEKDRYLPNALHSALQIGNFTAHQLLTGITDFFSNAEQWKWRDLNKDYLQLLQYAEEYVIPSVIQQYSFSGPNVNTIKDIIRWKYLRSTEKDVSSLAERIHNLQWEALVAAPHDRQLSLLVNSSASVYTYCLHQYNTLANISATFAIGGDLLLLFGPVLLQQIARRRFNIAESTLSQQLKKIWVNFARQGYPTSSNEYHDIWQPYTHRNKYVHYFGDAHWNSFDYQSSISFWNELLPKLAYDTNKVNRIPKELQLSPDPAAGFRHAMYTLVGLVTALLALLLVCAVLLKKRAKEMNRHLGFH